MDMQNTNEIKIIANAIRPVQAPRKPLTGLVHKHKDIHSNSLNIAQNNSLNEAASSASPAWQKRPMKNLRG